MARRKETRFAVGAKSGSHGATTGYETELRAVAHPLRGSMDAAEHERVVLGLISLKYIEFSGAYGTGVGDGGRT